MTPAKSPVASDTYRASAVSTGLAARSDQYDRPVRDCSDVLRYVRDPEFRAQIDAEIAAERAATNAVFDRIRRAQQQAVWARDEQNSEQKNMGDVR